MKQEHAPLIESSVKTEIMNRLAAAEKEHAVRILYCCESGSRAWGFPSPDSDYDVRFIYVRSEDWYLSFDVERKRDVIEYPIVDEIDCGGWDLRKALYLFTRSNGALIEWLSSPIRYIDIGNLASKLLELAKGSINLTALCYHYSHMARGNAREYLDKKEVRLKKYLYVLRPLLAIRYIEEGHGIPPVEFSRLVEASAPAKIVPFINKLLARKRSTPELGKGPKIDALNCFIQSELERHNDAFKGIGRPEIKNGHKLREELNQLFRQSVRKYSRTIAE